MTPLLTALATLALMATVGGELRAAPVAAVLVILTIISLLRK